jgi:hypothetical protein
MEKLAHGMENFRMGLLLFRNCSVGNEFKYVSTQRTLEEHGYFSKLSPGSFSTISTQCTHPSSFEM